MLGHLSPGQVSLFQVSSVKVMLVQVWQVKNNLGKVRPG
jgi:hypothetical protein